MMSLAYNVVLNRITRTPMGLSSDQALALQMRACNTSMTKRKIKGDKGLP
jgi:hypothetical protein